MTDIFDARIMCKKCNKEMKSTIVNRNGLELRAVECSQCRDNIIHPADLNGSEHFNNLKGKTFNVKLRMVGNSHAISIPKEIIEFVNERHGEMRRDMDDMVRLCFEDFDRLSVRFWGEDSDDIISEEQEDLNDADDIDRMKIKKIRRD